MVHRLRGSRAVAMLFVVVLSAAVTATVTSGVAAAKAPSAAVGVDPATSTVKIAVIGLNVQALVDAGVIPDLGKPVDQFKELQNEINAGSKAGKYKLDVAVQLLPSQPKPEDYQAACLWATEEQKAFMVVFASVSAEDLARCITIDHKTPAIGNVGFTAQLYKDAKGLLFTDGNTGMSIDRQTRGVGAGLRRTGPAQEAEDRDRRDRRECAGAQVDHCDTRTHVEAARLQRDRQHRPPVREQSHDLLAAGRGRPTFEERRRHVRVQRRRGAGR